MVMLILVLCGGVMILALVIWFQAKFFEWRYRRDLSHMGYRFMPGMRHIRIPQIKDNSWFYGQQRQANGLTMLMMFLQSLF